MNYDWTNYRREPWNRRFPPQITGLPEWERRSLERDWLPTAPAVAPPCPRVFVSHRQADRNEALRVAYLANQNGFEYWLDVLDLSPAQVPAGHSPALAIAQIIEMALLNCSHVAAVFTVRTPGSLWVPYEYGRVKEPRVITIAASAWVQPSITSNDLPEYLLLGPIHRSESHLCTWFQTERKKWRGTGLPQAFPGSTPPALPS
jgi:hypothetical protein